VNSILQNQLGLKTPIVQAPMAGGPTTPELVAAVVRAGALGSFGFAYTAPDQIETLCEAFSSQCAAQGLSAPYAWNANFFVFPQVFNATQTDVARAKGALESMTLRAGIDAETIKPDTQLPHLADQVDAALHHSPAVVSFHLGVPSIELVNKIHAAGVKIFISATSVFEALQAKDAGADYIVAQGTEAGGHRGIYDPDGQDELLSATALVAQLVERVDLPVIASGGIMNGADIFALSELGADAVQMGSAFLTVNESGVCDTYRAALATVGDRETEITYAFSGRPARGIQNLFMDSVGSWLPFPLQNTLTGSLRKAAGQSKDFEMMSLWAGTRYSEARNCSVQSLIDDLNRELQQAAHSSN